MTDVRPGDRIRLIEMPDDPAPVEPGTEGVVGQVTESLGTRQISVKWDTDRRLMLIVPPDRFDVVGHEAIPEPWASIYPTEEGGTRA